MRGANRGDSAASPRVTKLFSRHGDRSFSTPRAGYMEHPVVPDIMYVANRSAARFIGRDFNFTLVFTRRHIAGGTSSAQPACFLLNQAIRS